MKPLRSAEAVLAELEKICAGYRKHVNEHGPSPDLRARAIADIRALGFTEGDALRWTELKRR